MLYRFFLTAAILVLVVLQGCRARGNDPLAVEGTRTEAQIALGGPVNISMLPIIAEERGFFETEGVEVKFTPLQTGKIAMDSLLNGDLDIGILVDSNIAFIGFQQGVDIDLIASVGRKTDDALVVRRDKGISGPNDLVGKKIGYLPATTSHVFLARFLAHHGLQEKDVILVPLAPPLMQASIIAGDVDAVSVWQPFRYHSMQALESGGLEFGGDDVYTSHILLAARRQFADESGDACRRLLKALMRAESFAASNPAEAINIVSRRIGIDRKTLEEYWSEYKIEVGLETSLLRLLQEEGEWIRSTQADFMGKPIPDYASFIRPQLLQSVGPSRVKQ